MTKKCPYLIHRETHLSCTERGASYTNTRFGHCIRKECAAYYEFSDGDGYCNAFGRTNSIELEEKNDQLGRT